MIETIKEYRKTLLKRQILWLSINSTIILLSIAALLVLISVIAGWCQNMKVDDVLSQVLLTFLTVILIAIAALVSFQMIVIRKKYRMALFRLDFLILNLKINEGKSKSLGWIERELQLITNMLGS